MKVKVFLMQLKSKVGDFKYNLDRAISVIKEDVLKDNSNVDLKFAIFPELYLPGYLAQDLHFRLAKTIDSEEVKILRRLIKNTDTYIIIGLAEKDETFSGIYNSALLLSPDGRYMFFRKRHLPTYGMFDEYRYFKPYRGSLRVFKVNEKFRVGVGICYDAFFPEISRTMLFKNAVMHVYISAAPDMSRKFFETFISARAMENTIYVAYVNSVGFYDGIGFFGGSFIVNPLGEVICRAKYFSEDVVSAVINIDEINYLREKRPIIKDISILDIDDMRNSFLNMGVK